VQAVQEGDGEMNHPNHKSTWALIAAVNVAVLVVHLAWG